MLQKICSRMTKKALDHAQTLLVGDVHGCVEELMLLLERAKQTSHIDKVILLGDLINKGPYSFEVLTLAKKENFICLMGNHELNFLNKFANNNHAALSPELKLMVTEMGPRINDWVAYIQQFLPYFETDTFFAVHAGIRPDMPPHQTRIDELCNIRRWDGKGNDLQSEHLPPWYYFYKELKPIIFGHWAKQGLIIKNNIIGLDSGCVYGKKLSAVLMPSRQLLQVDAKRVYQTI